MPTKQQTLVGDFPRKLPSDPTERSRATVRPSEVSFDDLDNAEMEEQFDCACYEYGRDCGAVLRAVGLIKQWFPGALVHDSVQQLINLDPSDSRVLDKTFCDRSEVLRIVWGSAARICLIAPEFRLASTPWLKIPKKVRDDGKHRLDWTTHALNLQLDWRLVRTGRPLEKVALASFPIDSWGLDNEALMRQFGQWLKKHRPTDPYHSKKGRTLVPRDWLQHLAVNREREFNRQHGLSINTPPRFARHSAKRTFQRSAVEARRIMTRLFSSVLRLGGCKE